MHHCSRRAFLRQAACGLMLLPLADAAAAEPAATQPAPAELPVTGLHQPDLAAFDQMMLAFLKEHGAPGASLAVTRGGRLVYARGFGYADREAGEPVRPDALFRIASVSKPLTAVAVLQLVERGRLALDTPAFELLRLAPADARLHRVTILHLLLHTAGWDRALSFDPGSRHRAIAEALGEPPPPTPRQIVEYMLDKPLDFDPGARHAYSNFGYCVLGRVIERVSGMPYETYVRARVLAPLGVHAPRIGKTLREQRVPREGVYYDEQGRTAPAVVGNVGERVAAPYGGSCHEARDSHGGWIASAVDLTRFAAAFDDPQVCRILRPPTIAAMFARPEGPAGLDGDEPKPWYYGCGWKVRPVGRSGRANTWHLGFLPGSNALLVRRHDGLNWAVLFNTRRGSGGVELAAAINPLVHQTATAVRRWPAVDLFGRHL